jgi:thiol:disulfide interchange protein DsbC
MRTLTHFMLFLFTLVSFQLSFAKSTDEEANIRQVLKNNFADLVVDEVKASPVKGIYQVSAGPTIIYVTGDAHYAFSGDIIDLQNAQTNLTEDARKQARLAGLKALGEENMIIFSPKNPKYTVTVFTDVDCGYCRKMQNEMSKINELGIAVRYLAFPRSGPNTPTYDKMVSVWCAKDKKGALAAAKANKPVAENICPNNSVMKDFQYGMQVGVNGTPTLIFEDGTMVPGYLPPEKLLEAAEQLAVKKTT